MLDPLTPTQLRVLGALAEKAATVPDTYPMTLNGLRTACNQKNSRDPVTDYDEYTVLTTLDELKALGLVRFVYASHGARSTKYRHVLDERLGLDPAELAVLTVLALRGAQTVNELRTRSERAHTFEDNHDVEETLRALAGRDAPLVRLLERQPGQKESRWMHLLGDHSEPGAPVESASPGVGTDTAPVPAPDAVPAVPPPTVAASDDVLERRLASLEARVAVLEELLTGDDRPSDHQEHPS